MNKNFNTSLTQGERGGAKCEDFFDYLKGANSIKDWCRTPHYLYDHLGIDAENDYVFWMKTQTKGAEVKTLAGVRFDGTPCSTGVIEFWKDDAKTKRAGWWKSVEKNHLNFIFFVNEFTDKVYVFDALTLKNYLDNSNPYLTRCKDPQQANNYGWIAFFNWEDEKQGWLFTITKEENKWIKTK